MSTVKMFGYLRSYSQVKAHDVHSVTDEVLADALVWSIADWRDDPEWPCVAIGHISIQREPREAFASAQVNLLRAKQREVLAAAQAASTELDRQINELLAITNEVPA
jgi:hypothetical protein